MGKIIDFLAYMADEGTIELHEDDDLCERPFHGRLNIRRGAESFICFACLVDVHRVFHPSFEGGKWVERSDS